MNLKKLIRRTVEIDYRKQHRHASGSLSALPIMVEIFKDVRPEVDTFILSKGHAAPAYYAILEELGYKPDISHPHPYRDPERGIPATTGSLGHGLPLAVGWALANKMRGEDARVYVLLGDGEALEGTTWESLHLAAALKLEENLFVHVDANGWQGSCRTICKTEDFMPMIFPVTIHRTKRGAGVRLLEENESWHTHTITDEEFATIMEDLK
jgi:transketolase N-terminal domain/subunit